MRMTTAFRLLDTPYLIAFSTIGWRMRAGRRACSSSGGTSISTCSRSVKRAPGEQEEQRHHGGVGRVAEPLVRIELVNLGEGQDEGLGGAALDLDLLSLLDDGESLAGLEPELLAALAEQVLDRHQDDGH